ncbi:translin-associated protein X [Drosophila guanche]|uniref:Blast:Translin-associated protein X n=1 Tax=Drosophila guanche TaxID=7266 RepID=A0A3B0JF38_DROGU|nr:translin-associated protein X [Drosophila guanche]SPP80745.1 blast:Translin-associated protein X [Drosophila guanche]
MSKQGGGSHRNNAHKKRQPQVAVDEDNPIVQAFRNYSTELTTKHDRHERIVKLSRDITIESKRIIFTLHSIDSRKQNKEKILEEAQQRLNKLIEVNFRSIALELRDQDVYQYRNAYSAGLQEFIEAYTYMEYLSREDNDEPPKSVSDWQALQSVMQYVENPSKAKDEGASVEETDAAEEELPKKFQFFIDPTEYVLGLSDLTGELMRRCINSLGSGDTDTCMETCSTLQMFYTGYISLNLQRARELWRKITTMRQSVLKAENVCYNVKVRGGEAAVWGSNFDQKPAEDVDEGFY